MSAQRIYRNTPENVDIIIKSTYINTPLQGI